MGLSQAEVRLRRLLAAAPSQKNQVKLLHYVTSMRELLGTLTGGEFDGLNQTLPLLSEEQVAEYTRSINEIADRIDSSLSPDVWVALEREEGNELNTKPDLELDSKEPVLAPSTFSQGLRNRRLLREVKRDGGKVEGDKLDAATLEVIDKHRHLQEALTDEMAQLSEQLKNNSYLMEKSIRDTAHYVDATDSAIEHNLATTNRINERASLIYKSNWKTGCYTWLLLILMIFVFVFMVGLIRVTG